METFDTSGVKFKDFPEHTLQEARDELKLKDDDLTEEDRYIIQLYLKVGKFMNLSWKSFFEETPLWVIDAVNDEIDQRLAPYIAASSGEGSGTMPLDYFHLALLLALSSAFGGGSN